MRWGGIFDVDGLRHTVDRLTNLSLREGFWDDPERAQRIMRERANAEETVTKLEKLTREVKDLLELLTMVDEDPSVGPWWLRVGGLVVAPMALAFGASWVRERAERSPCC